MFRRSEERKFLPVGALQYAIGRTCSYHLPTLRPNDDPGQPFHYRLRRVHSTIVHKTHITYPLSEEKMRRFEVLFLAPDWDIAQLPDYSPGHALNPFITFAAIPARARYQFMLNNAQYTVYDFHPRTGVPRGRLPRMSSMISSMCCFRIRMRILVGDLDPGLSGQGPAALGVDPRTGALIEPGPDWAYRQHERNEYIRLRPGQAIRELQPEGPSLEDIWHGEGTNTNAGVIRVQAFR